VILTLSWGKSRGRRGIVEHHDVLKERGHCGSRGELSLLRRDTKEARGTPPIDNPEGGVVH